MHKHRRRGFSLIELLVVIAIILIILTIAVPRFGAAQMYAAELAAIRAIQTIQQAQTQYSSQFGKYASTLAQLAPPASGGSSPLSADLIPNNLASGEKGGYIFTLTVTPSGYSINANPKVYNNTGTPHILLRPTHADSSELVPRAVQR